MDQVQYSIRIYGKVQGVWFRKSTQDKAHELEVKGYVRNDPDGTVYIRAQGSEEAMQTFLNWCHQGPPYARVDKVETESGPIQSFEGFEIRRS